MKVDVKEEVKSIVCNASNLSVSAATVETDAGELLMPEVKADQETESLSLLLGNQALQAGPSVQMPCIAKGDPAPEIKLLIRRASLPGLRCCT